MDLTAELDRLKSRNAELELRVQELTVTCEDLASICAAQDANYEEKLAALRHRRSFAQTYLEHPLEAPAAASEATESARAYSCYQVSRYSSFQIVFGCINFGCTSSGSDTARE